MCRESGKKQEWHRSRYAIFLKGESLTNSAKLILLVYHCCRAEVLCRRGGINETLVGIFTRREGLFCQLAQLLGVMVLPKWV